MTLPGYWEEVFAEGKYLTFMLTENMFGKANGLRVWGWTRPEKANIIVHLVFFFSFLILLVFCLYVHLYEGVKSWSHRHVSAGN